MHRYRRRRSTGPTILAVSLLTTGLALVPSAYADSVAGPPARVETQVASSSPVTKVAESEVQVRIPLPAAVGTHPPACDWLSYLRYRDVNGPAASADADKILIAQPGILAGAGSFDSVARNTVAAAAATGKHIEFWALDRRSNCLEDHTGIDAGRAAGSAEVAVDYYYNHKAINGKTFAGYYNNSNNAWLGKIGIEQTVEDEYNLMVAELPDQSVRKQKVLCGGHSLGGTITGFFATWDFNGQAGADQCSGYFALDTTISTSRSGATAMAAAALPDPGSGYDSTQAGLADGSISRSIDLPAVINPQTLNTLGIAGLGALLAPNAPSVLTARVPADFNVDTTFRVLFSRDLLTALTGSTSIRQFRLTNDAFLGGLFDNNSEPLALLQASLGFFGGGPVVDKDFPLPFEITDLPILKPVASSLFGPDRKAIPAVPDGPLYTWRNYNSIGAPGEPVATSRDGRPFTTPADEVTDIHELARSLAEQPLDFAEQYFPTKIVTDLSQAGAPQISSHLVHPDGIAANPTINLLGGKGLVVGGAGTVPAGNTVIAPGYHHLDVITAAPVQNNAQPELLSTKLAQFAATTQ
ncbi:MAG: hypothetical protein ABI251_00040 [Mycobacteriaceae bacterium]